MKEVLHKEEVLDRIAPLFSDRLAAEVWLNKYAAEGEQDPRQMFTRLTLALARKEFEYYKKARKKLMYCPWLKKRISKEGLDYYSRNLQFKDLCQEIMDLLKGFNYVILGGSMMASLGTKNYSSISNCFVIGQPEDSINGINLKRAEQSNLMKRRGGVGKDLSTLRPRSAAVKNAAKTSTGAVSFMNVDSEITREIAQEGRRGALMITLSVKHPDILEFINAKQNESKITGANISVKVSNDFMLALEREVIKDNKKVPENTYFLRYPVDYTFPFDSIKDGTEYRKEVEKLGLSQLPVNTLIPIHKKGQTIYVKKVNAKEIWNTLVHCAWNRAEPGVMFDDIHINYSPDGVYPQYRGVTTNPCFHPDTLIETVEGRKRIADITEPTYVYSMSREGNLCVVPSSAAFKTQLNAKTLKITLRNGSSIMVTPNHKMYVQDRGWVQAEHLLVGDRIAHILRSRRGKKYVGIKLTTQGNRDYRMEHRLVYESVFGYTNHDIHHIDGDTFNNSITNLEALPHTEHSKITATEQNPQTHQERDHTGRFVSYKEDKIIQGVKNLPEDLATNFKGKFDNCIVSIEEGQQTDVYDIQVPDTHCLIANNMVAHNCGEIFMQPYDSCRLLHHNLFSYIQRERNKDSILYGFDFNKFKKNAYLVSLLADDLVDLEVDALDSIINKIQSEHNLLDADELEMWQKLRENGLKGRRCGIGITALADTIAYCGYKYGSPEANTLEESIFSSKLDAELKAQGDMAVIRGTFDGWDRSKEFSLDQNFQLKGNNDFYQFLCERAYPKALEESNEKLDSLLRIYKYGHRNISWSTVAPTGSVSILAGTTSGIEPLFLPYYTRSRKVLEGEPRDFTDSNGDGFINYLVVHPKLKFWIKDHCTPEEIQAVDNNDFEVIDKYFKESPYYQASAADLPVPERVKIQAIAQKYTTHSISSTINLAKETTVQTVSDIYKLAYSNNLKGITVYRDGCRQGILNSIKSKKEEFPQYSAPKRPKVLQAEARVIKNKGKLFKVIVGLLDNKPYEIFASETKQSSPTQQGTITKIKKHVYKWESTDGEVIENIRLMSNIFEERACTLYLSMLLRHGVRIPYIIKTARKVDDNIVSFTSAICRVLGKYTEEEVPTGEVCPDCGKPLIREGGCIKCSNCSYSACMLFAKR